MGKLLSPQVLFRIDVKKVCGEVAKMLIKKNRLYGDAALNPLRIFSGSDPVEQIKVRLDDKLSRIARGDRKREDEDVEKDLLGYLVLLQVARCRNRRLRPKKAGRR